MKSPLAVRDGIAPSYLWLPEGQWTRLLDFLCAHFSDVPEQVWRARMAKNELVDQHATPLHENTAYQRGLCIFYYREVENEAPIPFKESILHADEHLIVVDKPHFLPVTPGGQYLRETLLVRLKRDLGIDALTPIHRLDRETAGVIIFSCNEQTRGAYQSMFQQRSVEKTYEALAHIHPDLEFPLTYRSRLAEADRFFIMREIPGVANTETHISILQKYGNFCVYQLKPVSGKKHQLRVHMAALGIPILNDSFYPIAQQVQTPDYSKPLKLLARNIAFIDPISGLQRQFTSAQNLL